METFEGLWLITLMSSTIILGIFDYQTVSVIASIIILIQTICVIIFFILHIVFEGISFIMIGAYIIFITHYILFAFPISFTASICIISFLIFIELCSGILSILLPIPRIPKVNGSFDIGTKLLCFDTTFYTKTNNSIKNIDHIKKGDSKYIAITKPFYIRIWYPSNNGNNTRKYRNNRCYKIHPKDDKLKKRIFPNSNDRKNGYNYTIFLSKDCRVNSVLNGTPINNKRFGLLIYSHGQNSYPERNTYLIEELVSNGYIVCAPYHDDRNREYPGPIRRRQIDIDFTIKYMMDINDGDYYKEFKNMIDFSNGIGLIGHSMGAMACIVRGATWKINDKIEELHRFYKQKYERLNNLYCITRIIALDAWLEYLDMVNVLKSVDIPMIICSTDGWRNYREDIDKLNGYIKKRKDGIDIYEMKLFNSLHSNPTDFAIYHKYKFGKHIFPSLVLKNRKDIPLKDDQKITFCDIGDGDSENILLCVIQIAVKYFDFWKKGIQHFDIKQYKNNQYFSIKPCF